VLEGLMRLESLAWEALHARIYRHGLHPFSVIREDVGMFLLVNLLVKNRRGYLCLGRGYSARFIAGSSIFVNLCRL